MVQPTQGLNCVFTKIDVRKRKEIARHLSITLSVGRIAGRQMPDVKRERIVSWGDE